MKTDQVTTEDLSASVIAVPPLARNEDLSLNHEANRKQMAHLRGGGVTTYLYGGNANLYSITQREYAELLAMLEEQAQDGDWIIPSAGPDLGRLTDQAEIINKHQFPTVMVLPTATFSTPDGVEESIRRFVDQIERPVIVYLKREDYLRIDQIAKMLDENLLCAVKYAIDREDAAVDPFLVSLLSEVPKNLVVSGFGERPALTHMRGFGVAGYTAGCVCIAPSLSANMLSLAKAGDWDKAEQVRKVFLPLESLRDGINPVRVLHEAVTLSGIADMGPIMPPLSGVPASDLSVIEETTKQLLALN